MVWLKIWFAVWTLTRKPRSIKQLTREKPTTSALQAASTCSKKTQRSTSAAEEAEKWEDTVAAAAEDTKSIARA